MFNAHIKNKIYGWGYGKDTVLDVGKVTKNGYKPFINTRSSLSHKINLTINSVIEQLC